MNRKGRDGEIICPYCEGVQELDVYDMVDDFSMEGNFDLECIHCPEKFNVKFEFVSKVETKRKEAK